MTSIELKQLRKQLMLTQLQLAERLHKTVRQIQNYEWGKTPIPYLVGMAVKEILNQEIVND